MSSRVSVRFTSFYDCVSTIIYIPSNIIGDRRSGEARAGGGNRRERRGRSGKIVDIISSRIVVSSINGNSVCQNRNRESVEAEHLQIK